MYACLLHRFGNVFSLLLNTCTFVKKTCSLGPEHMILGFKNRISWGTKVIHWGTKIKTSRPHVGHQGQLRAEPKRCIHTIQPVLIFLGSQKSKLSNYVQKITEMGQALPGWALPDWARPGWPPAKVCVKACAVSWHHQAGKEFSATQPPLHLLTPLSSLNAWW